MLQEPPQTRAMTRITVMQGNAIVSAGPRVELTTVLGSCVATCLFDPEVELGGMNHFLLAEPPESRKAQGFDEHYGVYLMEVLINQMLAHGASKLRLRAHLYGGANLHTGMARIGTVNADFAQQFLLSERIPLIKSDLGGTQAQRVDFRPASGQVRCRLVENAMAPDPQPIRRPAASVGDVELF